MKTHSKTRKALVKESKVASSTRPPQKMKQPTVVKGSQSVRADAPARPDTPRAKASPRSKASRMASPRLSSRTLPVMASGISGGSSDQPRGIVQSPVVTASRAPIAKTRSRKPRLLWIGDACVPTGFATVTHAVLDHLRRDWNVIVSGINYDGAPHSLPYDIMPAWQGGDMWGTSRFQHLCAEFEPAAVVINNDWWNVAQFARLAPAGVPVIGYMPVDGGNLEPADMTALNKLQAAVWYTGFGHREAVKAGFKGARHVIPHGIDTTMFHPMERDEARRILDLNVPKNAFIVGNLNRNQPRKRLDVTVQIFADWVKQHHIPNAFLLLHCAKKDSGWDLRRIAAFHGVADRLLLTGEDDIRDMQSVRHLELIYNSLDVQMTTTLGEGWGLTTMEGMACGIPQVVPDSSALAEWAAPALKIPCSRLLMHPEINTTGALVDDVPFVAALQSLYQDKGLRTRLSAQGLELTRRPEFHWENVARQFHSILAPVRRRKAAKSLTPA